MIKTLLVACVLAMASHGAAAEEGPFAPAAPPQETRQAGLDALLAPIALYPDELLAQVLAASTYPLEVVALHRWLDARPGVEGEALEAGLAAQPWAQAVKALAPFRSVVAMMDGELEWTQRLGDAFLASEADVMDAVQRLRRKAREAGSLADNDRERIVVENDIVTIEPAQGEVVYVPVYDPYVVYGPWWWPGYPPYVWTGAWFGPWDYVAGGIYFGLGVRLGYGWRWHVHPDWHGHRLAGSGPGVPPVWRHEPSHRGAVPYSDPRARDRYRPVDRDRARSRQDFRGFDVRPQSPPANRTGRPAPPAGASPLAPVPRERARQDSQRGRESLGAPRPQPQSQSRSQPQPQPQARSRPRPPR